MRYSAEEQATALHEAGHVVVCYAIAGGIQVTTVEAEDSDIGGCAPCETTGEDIFGHLLVSTAGLAAETLYGPDAKPEAPFPEVLETDYARYARDDLQGAIDFLCEEVVLMGVPRPPCCSRAVATKAIGAAFREVRDFLADHEPVIRKVADRLLKDGTLRPKQLYPLLPDELFPKKSLRAGVQRVYERAKREEGEE